MSQLSCNIAAHKTIICVKLNSALIVEVHVLIIPQLVRLIRFHELFSPSCFQRISRRLEHSLRFKMLFNRSSLYALLHLIIRTIFDIKIM